MQIGRTAKTGCQVHFCEMPNYLQDIYTIKLKNDAMHTASRAYSQIEHKLNAEFIILNYRTHFIGKMGSINASVVRFDARRIQ